MSDAGKELLRRSRTAFGPSDEQKKALRRKVLVSTAAAGAAGATALTASTAKASASSIAGWKLAVGIGAVVVVAGVATPQIVHRLRASETRTETQAARVTHASASTSASTLVSNHEVVGSRERGSNEHGDSSNGSTSPNEQAMPHVAAHSGSRGAAHPSIAPTNLSAEALAVLHANEAIRRGDVREAMRIVTSQPRDFAHPQLREEWLALRAMALCGSGEQTRGQAAAQELRAHFPRSVHMPRVTAACAGQR